MVQEQVAKPAPKERKRVSTIERPKAHQETQRETDAKAKATIADELLDEIDEILNSEGVEQLVNFQQKGGE